MSVQGMLDDRSQLKWRRQTRRLLQPLAMMDTRLSGIILIAADTFQRQRPGPGDCLCSHDPLHPLRQYPRRWSSWPN